MQKNIGKSQLRDVSAKNVNFGGAGIFYVMGRFYATNYPVSEPCTTKNDRNHEDRRPWLGTLDLTFE